MSGTVQFFAPTPNGRDVISKFLKNELKKRPETQAQLLDQLKILENTSIDALRKTGKIEHVEGDIFSFRFHTPGHWVRLLLACWPTDNDIVILLPLLKQQNKLSRPEIEQAKTNLRILQNRTSTLKGTKT